MDAFRSTVVWHFEFEWVSTITMCFFLPLDRGAQILNLIVNAQARVDELPNGDSRGCLPEDL